MNNEPERATVCRTAGLSSLAFAAALLVGMALYAINKYNADKADGWGSYDELTEEVENEV